jgi:hypothetical protein
MVFSRVLVIAAVVIFFADASAAQTHSWLLNRLEVQRLVEVNTAEAHARLSKHFIALTETYRADAARYTARAQGFVSNPNHGSGVNTDVRRIQQAQDAARRAEATRAMVVYHQLLSVGAAAVPPPDRAQFDGGDGAAAPTQVELSELARRARTPADHRVLAEYYLTLETRETALANEHARMASMHRVSGERRAAEIAAIYCDRMARLSREAAKHASAAASVHRQLASIG